MTQAQKATSLTPMQLGRILSRIVANDKTIARLSRSLEVEYDFACGMGVPYNGASIENAFENAVDSILARAAMRFGVDFDRAYEAFQDYEHSFRIY